MLERREDFHVLSSWATAPNDDIPYLGNYQYLKTSTSSIGWILIDHTTEDLDLDPEDVNYGDIPLVSDSEEYSVFCIKDCKTYQEAKKTGDFDVSMKKKRRTLKDKLTPTLYEHRKFLPKNVNFIDLNAPDPTPESSTRAKWAHINNDKQEHAPQKKTRVDNNVPGPSKLKTCELTAVAGPSKPKKPRTEVVGPGKPFEMTPKMLAAIAQMVMSMQRGDDDNSDNSE
ncbi:hypothetical protein DXG01_016247 [Tephrocybe rancida]|nr:hypothetical protein DXG01_016247 [Tephrocybe rancida]